MWLLPVQLRQRGHADESALTVTPERRASGNSGSKTQQQQQQQQQQRHYSPAGATLSRLESGHLAASTYEARNGGDTAGLKSGPTSNSGRGVTSSGTAVNTPP